MSTHIQSIVVRSARTFAQAFLAALALSAASVTDTSTAQSALVAAAAAALAAALRVLDFSAVPTPPAD